MPKRGLQNDAAKDNGSGLGHDAVEDIQADHVNTQQPLNTNQLVHAAEEVV